MRRPELALSLAVLAIAASAPARLGAQQLPPARGPAAAPASNSMDPSQSMAAARSARSLLRNGQDFIAYGEFDRALQLLREAEIRKAELTDREVQELQKAIRDARDGLRASDQSPAVASVRPRRGTARQAGAIALAVPAIPDAPVQRVAATRVEPAAPAPEPAALPPLPMTAVPTEPVVEPAALALAEPPPQATGRVLTSEPLRPSRPSPSPATEVAPAAPVAVNPAPADAPPTIPDEGAAELPAATPVTAPAVIPEAAPAVAPEAVAELPAPPPPLVNPTPPPAPTAAPLPELPPTALNEPPPAAEPLPPAPLSTEPAVVVSPPVETPAVMAETSAAPTPPAPEPAPTALADRPLEPAQAPAPASAPAPVEATAPLPAPAEELPAAPSPASAPPAAAMVGEPSLPPLPGTTAPATATPARASATGPGNLGAGGNAKFDFPQNLQREVEEIARRQAEERRTGSTRTPGLETSLSSEALAELGQAESRIKLPRPPSPTQPQPIRAIPVPENFVPLQPRSWSPNRKVWASAATCHGPLYFQDAVLERYGQSVEQAFGPAGRYMTYPLDDPKQSKQRNQLFQPLFSAGLFAFQVAALPYNLVVDPPWEAEYDLGYYRPGDRIPPDTYYLPWHGVGPPLHSRDY